MCPLTDSHAFVVADQSFDEHIESDQSAAAVMPLLQTVGAQPESEAEAGPFGFAFIEAEVAE